MNVKNEIKEVPKVLKAVTGKKIFCISMQRTGTTSVGQFFIDHNYRVGTWRTSHTNEWSLSWVKGDYEKIFNSYDFKTRQVFEDGPWWQYDFYKYLFHRFPKAKFILLERETDKWFDSMMKHSNGKTLGNTYNHAITYNRLDDFYKLDEKDTNIYNSEIDNLLSLDESHRLHYKNIYLQRNKEIKRYFEHFGPERLVNAQLEDKSKWQKIGSFFNIDVSDDYEIHANKSK